MRFSMQSPKVVVAVAVAALALAGAGRAEDQPPFKLAFNVGATTDYVFRGISLTDEKPQAYGGIDAVIGSIGYAGVWVSNVDFGNGTDAEVDVYAGVTRTVGPVSLDIGVLYYGYIGAPDGSHQGYFEAKALASVPAGPATLGAAFYYSPEYFGKTGDAAYYEVNAALPLGDGKFTLSGALGYQQFKGPTDYTTWNVGIGYQVTDNVGLDVRYHDTDEHGFGSLYDSRVVAGVKVVF